MGSSASGNLSVTLNNITVTDTNGDPLSSTTTASDIIRVLSDINTLSNIIINEETIEVFSSSVNSYELIMDSNKKSINIEISKTDDTSEVAGDIGEKELKYGINKFEIIVTSETVVENKYTLLIERKEIRELKSLIVNDEEINLEDGIYEYSLTVDNNIASAEIVATLKNEDLSSFV